MIFPPLHLFHVTVTVPPVSRISPHLRFLTSLTRRPVLSSRLSMAKSRLPRRVERSMEASAFDTCSLSSGRAACGWLTFLFYRIANKFVGKYRISRAYTENLDAVWN